MARTHEDVYLEARASMQAEAAEQRALGTVCQSPVLMTSGAGGVNLQFNSSKPCDSTPHGDSLAYANPRSSGAQQPVAGYLQHTSHTEMDAHMCTPAHAT